MKSFFIHTALISFIVPVLLAGCHQQQGDYLAASSISKNGFARGSDAMRKAHGRDIRVWGFVDHSNLYGDEGAKQILEEWWSSVGPRVATWRFNLKSLVEDETGQSFPVYVPNDPGRNTLLKAFVADARTGRPTKVFVKGKLFTFEALTAGTLLTGLYLELSSSQDVTLEFSENP